MEATIGLYRNDCEIVLSHLKQNEKLLKLKRRWLMGRPISKSKEKHLNFRSIPESLLREDDMFFGTLTKHVEEAFGAREKNNIIEETKNLFDTYSLKGILLSCLEALTNKGLFHLAMLLTRGPVNCEKTRPKLKKEIRKLIRRVFRTTQCNIQIEILAKLSQLLQDPQNVRDSCLTLLIPKFHPHYLSAIKILDRLEELPCDALFAMHRKLRGAPASTPGLEQKKHGRSRTKLICDIRRISKEMLSKLGRGDELEGPLANALVAAGLLLNLSPGYSTSFVTDFNQFSPEIKMLQNEIAKAFRLLKVKAKVRYSKLEAFKLLVDPDANVQNACLRTAIKKMLIAYLFECSDMDTIPEPLSKALAIINMSSPSTPSGCFLKDKNEMGEDVECILNVSAQMKQIVSSFLPDHDFDEDYTDAYMEELEESDDDNDNYDYHDKSYTVVSGDSDGQQLYPRNIQRRASCSIESDLEESCGEYVPVDSQTNVDGHTTQYNVESTQKFGTSKISANGFSSHLPPIQRSNVAEESIAVDSESQVDTPFSNIFSSEGEKNLSNEQSAHTNLYLGIQEVSDETSMVAYDLIGQIMEKFAQEEGICLEPGVSSYLQGNCPNLEDQDEMMTCGENLAGSVVVQVVENLLPSLPKSAMEKLKELIL